MSNCFGFFATLSHSSAVNNIVGSINTSTSFLGNISFIILFPASSLTDIDLNLYNSFFIFFLSSFEIQLTPKLADKLILCLLSAKFNKSTSLNLPILGFHT